jgi:hypothetical protein
MKNALPLPGGGAMRRPGTFHGYEYSEAAAVLAPRLIPFVVAQGEAYALAVFPYNAVAASGGQVEFFRRGPAGMGGYGTVTGTHTWSANRQLSLFLGSYNSTPYDEVHDVQFVQSADVMWLVHPASRPKKLTRTARDTFTMVDFDSGLSAADTKKAYPWLPFNTTTTTIQVSNHAVGSGRTILTSAAVFSSVHVGAYFKIQHASVVGMIKITAVNTPGWAVADVIIACDPGTANNTPTAIWAEAAWSDYRGWPRAVGIYQNRLVYGGTRSHPDSLWYSDAFNYGKLEPTSDTDPRSSPTGYMAFTNELGSLRLNQIQWIASGETQVTGTIGEEWITTVERSDLGFGCDNCANRLSSAYGSSYSQAVRGGNEIFHCAQSADEVRALVFSDSEKSYQGEPVQQFFDHFPKPELRNSASIRKYRSFIWDNTRSILWCLDSWGRWFGMTRDRTQRITAWHQHELGGYDASTLGAGVNLGGGVLTYDPIYFSPSGSIVSMASIPNAGNGVNDLFIISRRKINGSWKYHLEIMIGKGFQSDTAYSVQSQTLNSLVDDALQATMGAGYAAADANYTGANVLEGIIPVGTAGGVKGFFKITGTVVTAGAFTADTMNLPDAGTAEYTLTFGRNYTTVIEPMRPEAGSIIGTAQGAIKKIHKITLRFWRTLWAKVGRDEDNDMDEVEFHQGPDLIGLSPELFEGDKTQEFDGDYDRNGFVRIICDEPLPFCLVGIISEGMTYD